MKENNFSFTKIKKYDTIIETEVLLWIGCSL